MRNLAMVIVLPRQVADGPHGPGRLEQTVCHGSNLTKAQELHAILRG
jgi:hypothetical protein